MWATWVLRIAIALQCLGMALPMVTHQTPSPLNEYLLHQGVEDATLRTIDQLAGFAMFGVAAVVLFFPIAPIVLLVAGWAGVWAWATQMNEGDTYDFIAMPAQAVRFVAPLALLLLLPWPGHYARAAWRTGGAMWLLRISAAAVFIAHGYEAFSLNQRFVDYILHGSQFFFATTWPQATAEWMLRLIGVQDILLAIVLLGVWPGAVKRAGSWRAAHGAIVGLVTAIGVYQLERFRTPQPFVDWLAAELSRALAMEVTAGALVLILAVVAGFVAMSCARHWRGLIIYMAAWGFLTAMARVIDGGFARIDDALIRACNGAAPLAVLLLLHLHPQPRDATQTAAERKASKRPAAPAQASPKPRPTPRPTEIPLHSEDSPPRRPI